MPESALAPEMSQLKAKLKATWEAGDYGVFATYMEPSALQFLERANIAPGTRLLDIACGAGQLTIPAAKRGIRVSAIDLAQNLVDKANERARHEGLDVEIRQGDAEALPYPDGSFDTVLSLIGAMFAPRPELVASEMVRVCRPGGRIIMGNWTPEGFIGEMFKTLARHVPPPPLFPSPVLWGREEVVKDRFGSGIREFSFTRQLYDFRYPFGPREVVDFFITYYGPTNRAFAQLDAMGQAKLKAELIALWISANRATDGTTDVVGEYLQVVGTRR